jgi:23S rRNA (cytidine2498-2'-O)-methyltransferase
MDEPIRWSGIRLQAGDRCAEIGSAPGGSCQALLDRGLKVIGIDPAEMDERVVAHESFKHLKKRVADCKREVFRHVDWLIADANVAPRYTLDSIQDIVTHSSVRVRGMLITLKLLEWKLADEIPAYLERIRSWGYQDVRIRQLASNRQEITMAVLKTRSFRRRVPRRG